MFDQYDYQQYGTTTAAPKYTKQNEKPMPSREELLARNSFPSVNTNRHLDKMLVEQKAESRLRAAAKRLDDVGMNPSANEVEVLIDLLKAVDEVFEHEIKS